MQAIISAAACQQWRGSAYVPASFVMRDGIAYWLEEADGQRRLAVLARPDHLSLADLSGERAGDYEGAALTLVPADHASARWLRSQLPWLQPAPIGLHASAGFGDRLGLATPGHIRALREVLAAAPGAHIAPIFAQQSIREMARTHRTPADVLDDATWGAFAAGWQGGVGADADHLKTTDDIDACAAEGYSLYTIDPGAYVDDAADSDDPATLRAKLDAVPWERLATTAPDFLRMYADRRFALEDRALTISEAEAVRAAVKYGAAIAHVAAMYRHLASLGIPFELEASVDETATPTTGAEHVIFASELRRLGVQWVSLAPRFIGAFEKGTDYIGDLAALQANLDLHAQIARALGPYKLSLHSGSDKFSVYPLFVEATRGMGHLKTAGTSYVEALRVIAAADPALFRDIVRFDAGRYATDRATYHVSAVVARLPDLAQVPDAALPALLDNHDVRQIVHVTYGSTLDAFHAPIFAVLRAHQSKYADVIARHFVRHLTPFAGMAPPPTPPHPQMGRGEQAPKADRHEFTDHLPERSPPLHRSGEGAGGWGHLFDLRGQVAVITGGSGVLGSAMARGLARAGVRVAILGRRIEACQRVAEAIIAEGGTALAVAADVQDRAALESAAAQVAEQLGAVDLLVCAAGGNDPRATVTAEQTVFDLDASGINSVLGSNFTGTVAACQVWGRQMAERSQGTIITIASMAALRPLSRVGIYGAAKAALVNFTQWLAVHMAQDYSPAIRVNAIAPGFFLTEQNRFLLTDDTTGNLTARGQAIIAHTPQRRFGAPEDLVGTLLWLASPAAAFVTGIVVPVDGGYAAFGGV